MIEETVEPNILQLANSLVSEDRQASYGRADQDFAKTAGVLTALGFQIKGKEIKAEHIPIIMIAVKLSRIMNNDLVWHKDSYIDLAGYARTAEIVHKYLNSN